MSDIRPAPGYLLVQPEKQESTTASGIVLPSNGQPKQSKGKVINSGFEYEVEKGLTRYPPAEVGEEVVYRDWGPIGYKHDGEDLIILKFEDVVAVITK